MQSELHPLNFFLPQDAKILMLGSFPPPKNKWSMDFYYPNIQNDMWRILGLIFFHDKTYFLEKELKSFNKEKVVSFCMQIGLALGDAATEIVRLKGNASDKYLQVINHWDPTKILAQIPNCKTIVITGKKSMDIFTSVIEVKEPKIGDFSLFQINEQTYKLWRMPSSSRAYPLPLEKKAVFYQKMFRETFG